MRRIVTPVARIGTRQTKLVVMVPDSRQLQFGPYRTPRFKYGQKVLCEARGEVKIVRPSSGRIPWPMGTNGNLGQLSLLLYGDLARAVRQETNAAVCHHWGVSRFSVSKWRKALGVRRTEGTTRWRVAYGKSPEAEEFIKAMATKARDPVRLAKIGAAKRGKPRKQCGTSLGGPGPSWQKSSARRSLH
jgi:hypothetical protein